MQAASASLAHQLLEFVVASVAALSTPCVCDCKPDKPDIKLSPATPTTSRPHTLLAHSQLPDGGPTLRPIQEGSSLLIRGFPSGPKPYEEVLTFLRKV